MKLVPVILCGGAGSRLWPLSRKAYPKPLLKLFGEYSLLQDTVKRAQAIDNVTAPLIITNEDHYFMIQEQLQAIDVEPLGCLLEPVGRNTAPAIAIAAQHLLQQFADEDVLMLVMPADHVIEDVDLFVAAVECARNLSSQQKLMTFGITPTAPKTGYGYIHRGAQMSEGIFEVSAFAEKPDSETAQRYLNSGEYLWNSGIFLMSVQTVLQELAQYAPMINESARQAYQRGTSGPGYYRLDDEAFSNCPEDSIDYAIMEKSHRVAVVPLAARWADVGDWAAIAEMAGNDENGNVLTGDVIAEDVRNSYLFTEGRLIAAVGLQDVIVISTKDAVLVAPKSRSQDVKSIVVQLQNKSHQAADEHARSYRPWGYFETLAAGEHFQVKRLLLKPGGKISLQLHLQRAEHWVVVAGVAEVIRGEEQFTLKPNESTFIPVGTRHRLANLGTEPLQVIEVQSGAYLGEDDIVRFDDIYGRKSVTTRS